MKKDYIYYQNYLGPIPEFLNKYLELAILIRLKDISLLCAMDYATKKVYDFAFYVSRFDHSLNTALITWKFTHSKEKTLSALFHDVASPVFSHVIDYMNGDALKQESTEEKTEEILRTSKELQECLKEDKISIEDIINFKQYSIVDLDRPKLCADRLDNIITLGMTWAKSLNFEMTKKIIDALIVVENEENVLELAFNNYDIAAFIANLNDNLNVLMHTNEDNYMMTLTSNMVRKCIDLHLVTYDELFIMGEHQIMEIIANSKENELLEMWDLFKNAEDIPITNIPPIKDKTLNPLIYQKRLH